MTAAKPHGFSLVEIVVALGIFATAILVIVGLLASNVQATNRTVETEIASRLTDTIRAELQRYGYAKVASGLSGTNPIYLVGTRDGARVLPTGEDASNPPVTGNPVATPLAAENKLQTDSTPGTPPGIAYRDRYFLVEVSAASKPPKPATANAETAFPVIVEVYWPYRLPTGPSKADTTTTYKDENSTVTDSRIRESFRTAVVVNR